MTRPIVRFLAAAILLSLAFAGTSSGATWPPSVVGTWMGVANQTNVKLVIASQDPAGKCKAIRGTLSNASGGGDSNVQGFYCPESGRISFVRKDPKSNETFQSYLGNLSDAGAVLHVGGTFCELNMPEHLGEYNFCGEMRKGH